MKIEIYTKANCPNCMTAKALLKAKGLEYTEVDLDNSEDRMAFFLAYPDIRQMPQIFIDSQRVGGLAGLQAALTTLLDARAQT
jgi:glutaredoxin 3